MVVVEGCGMCVCVCGCVCVCVEEGGSECGGLGVCVL